MSPLQPTNPTKPCLCVLRCSLRSPRSHAKRRGAAGVGSEWAGVASASARAAAELRKASVAAATS